MNNELYHYLKGFSKKDHKYISRKYVNGKWQYVYEKSGLKAYKEVKNNNAYENKNSAIQEMTDRANKAAETRDAYYIKRDIYENAKTGAEMRDAIAPMNSALEKAASAEKQYNQAEAKFLQYDKMIKKYEKTPLGKLDAKIDKGVAFVNKIFTSKKK